MNYAKTVKLMMRAYPRLFINEEDCLHQLFFVNGNGLHWEDGELTDGLTEDQGLALAARDRKEHEREERKDNLERKRSGLPVYHYYGKTLKETRQKELVYRREIAAEEADDCWFLLPNGEVGNRIYPLCAYAKIMSIPENVKPDWLKAAWKALTWAKSDKVRRTTLDDKYLKKAEKLLRVRQG